MEALFEVLREGVQVTIQDLGRFKYRHMGIPVSGVMDHLGYQIGNILMGNKRNDACIEISIGGTSLKALSDQYIVITGGDLSASLNGNSISLYQVMKLKKGDILTFNGAKSGVYSYIAVPNGICSQIDFESQSTYQRASFGLQIRKGTIIYGNSQKHCYLVGLKKEFIPAYLHNKEIYYVKSSHYQYLPDSLREALTHPLFIGSSNRMGMYLKLKEAIDYKIDTNILSEGTTYGTIQILPSGQPIILLADSQTTGGYATLGTIIHSELWKLAQMKQGQTIKLVSIDVDEARKRNKEYERIFHNLMLERKNIIKEC